MAVFSRKSFFSRSALVMSGVITLYRVFLRCFEKFITRLSRPPKLVSWLVGPSARGAFAGQNYKLSLFTGIITALEKYKSMFRWPQNGGSMSTESSQRSGESFLPTTAAKA